MSTPPDAAASGSPSGSKRLFRWLGIVLALVAVGFCAYALARDWDRVSAAFERADRGSLALALLLAAGSVTWLASLWQRCLRAFDVEAPLGAVVGWFYVGELGKYVPGGVWQVIGRGELAHRSHGIARTTSYASTLLAYGTMCLGALFVCGLMSPFLALGATGSPWAWVFTPAVVLVWLVVHPVVTDTARRVLFRVARRELPLPAFPWGTMCRLILWSVPAWVLLGASSAAVAHALGTPDSDLLHVALAAVAAWVVGFLAIPVPAGAGVREVVFATLSGLTTGPAIAIAVLARATLLVVDGLGGVLSLAAQRVQARRELRSR